MLVHLDPVLVDLTIDGETVDTTPEHPFYIEQYGWLDAGLLWQGAQVRKADGSDGMVQAVKVVDKQQVMYNLTIDTAHSFFVGHEHWLVHNCAADANNLKGSAYENILESKFSREGKQTFFRASDYGNRRSGFDLVTLEDNTVVINEAKFQNKLQFDDFTAITSRLESNTRQVIDSLRGNKNLSRIDKQLVRNTLNAYLSGSNPFNLKIRVITGKAQVGPRVMKSIIKKTDGLPVEFKRYP